MRSWRARCNDPLLAIVPSGCGCGGCRSVYGLRVHNARRADTWRLVLRRGLLVAGYVLACPRAAQSPTDVDTLMDTHASYRSASLGSGGPRDTHRPFSARSTSSGSATRGAPKSHEPRHLRAPTRNHDRALLARPISKRQTSQATASRVSCTTNAPPTSLPRRGASSRPPPSEKQPIARPCRPTQAGQARQPRPL